MCKKEQSYNITDKLILNTFELQVQPFAVENNKFNTGMYSFVMLRELPQEVIIQHMYNS